jgi:hypothetical protein
MDCYYKPMKKEILHKLQDFFFLTNYKSLVTLFCLAPLQVVCYWRSYK